MLVFRNLMSSHLVLVLMAAVLCSATSSAQELPKSGSFGWSFVYASDATGSTSQLFQLDVQNSATPIPIGDPVASVPSRWSHRRRTLGALETQIAYGAPLVLMTPMGADVGEGAVHLVDYRTSPVTSTLVPTQNPPGYDLAVLPNYRWVFSAEDTGSGTTLLRGWSWASRGQLIPLSPATLELPGAPSAYTQRLAVDEAGGRVWVPTSTGIQEVTLSGGLTNIALGDFLDTTPYAPTTNPVSFDRDGTLTWIVGTSSFASGTQLEEGGFFAWDASGASESGVFGEVPGVPGKNWIPSAGAEELGVIGDGTDTYVYALLREPPPGTFFIKGSAVGCVRFLDSQPAEVGTLPLSDLAGEPFANPSVSGTRMAFETSFGPPFVSEPADGGERVVILYSPLDTLGASSDWGEIGVAGALGGRISTKGMDRPIWSHDGTRVFAATSWFPGAPNPGVPGLEVLSVPDDVPVSVYTPPHTVVSTPEFPDQSIIFPALFDPRFPTPETGVFTGLSFVGHASHHGLGALAASDFGELGQQDVESPKLLQSSAIPNFRAILPAAFEDAVSSLFPIPETFGARRASFGFHPAFGPRGLGMFVADGDRLLLQATSNNTFASLGLLMPLPRAEILLPAGWTTTTEIFSF
ncbi:MAG: hypothetical protein DHS20C15_04190 [Planctomycetota bacterium]|nr:MAG: hypothetical protein DHS20C15_04190 [Planctomycetota bacterium]